MKIKKSSWHYRFINMHEPSGPPTNLCGYFGMLVALCLFWILLWWLILVVWAVITSDERATRKSIEKQTKEPGLIMCWISAKKRKVCPLIHFTEG